TNTSGTSPRRGFAAFYSDRTHANWSYFVLRNIQLGYDFSDLLKQANFKGVKGLTFNINLQNFFAFTDKRNRGYNPENGDVSTPWGKTIMFGLKANF
ncbi:MAG: TonB-dependent receptor, partial [Prevotella sp.]|nr:TonB-dependent receptor [Prevotella sp.]